jgi:type IV pilus assembly protein PilN
MIRINLLGEARRKRGPQNLFLTLVALNLGAIILAGGVTMWVNGEINRLRNEGESNKTVIETLKSKIDEMHKIQKLNKELELRGSLIETLRKNQSVPVRVLDEVSMLVPDGIWLSSLTFKDNAVSMEGNAFSNIDIVSFMDNLKKASDLTDVYLEESREGEIDKVKIYRFKANCKVKV